MIDIPCLWCVLSVPIFSLFYRRYKRDVCVTKDMVLRIVPCPASPGKVERFYFLIAGQVADVQRNVLNSKFSRFKQMIDFALVKFGSGRNKSERKLWLDQIYVLYGRSKNPAADYLFDHPDQIDPANLSDEEYANLIARVPQWNKECHPMSRMPGPTAATSSGQGKETGGGGESETKKRKLASLSPTPAAQSIFASSSSSFPLAGANSGSGSAAAARKVFGGDSSSSSSSSSSGSRGLERVAEDSDDDDRIKVTREDFDKLTNAGLASVSFSTRLFCFLLPRSQFQHFD
jgi:hypothetical protein